MKKTNSFLVILTSVMLVAGVLSFKTAKIRPVSASEQDFTVSTNLESVKEIHTDAQKAYLSYDGDFKTIPEDNYPDGQKHLSDPEPVNLAWDYTVPSGKTVSRYDVVIGKEADLKDGYTVKGTAEKSLDVYNSYLGDNYFKIVANFSDGTNDSSAIKKYTVDNVYPRNLKIDGMTNCRDMGGARELEDGGYIKQGLIYRTSGTHSWGNGHAVVTDTITNAGKEELLNHLGCKTEINVNNNGSNQVGVANFVDAYMYYDNGKHHMFRNTEPLKRVFHALADKDNYPVFYHCRIGTDRTGFVAIMLSALLGVSENDIYQDYLFSNFGNIQEKRYIGEKAGRDNILKYMDDLKTYPGEKLQNKAYNFLLSIGIPAEELDNIIDILTEGTKATGNNNHQQVVLANDFEGDGTEMKEIAASATGNAARAHPKQYFTLGADQSINAEFDPDYTGEAKLIAYLGSTDSSASKFIADSIKVEFDYDEIEIDEISFADAGFGQGEGRTYYAPVMLATVDVFEGNTPITVTGIANNLNIGALALIPTKPVEEKLPGPVGPDQPDQPEPEVEPKPESKGCGGSILAVSSLISMLAIGGVALIFINRRKED